MALTKIVATLGPASESPETIRRLMLAGVDVFRLNMSHGRQEDHAQRIRSVRALARELSTHTAILIDLQGPKIRLGKFENPPVLLQTGTTFTITTQPQVGSATIAGTTYADFAKDVQTGDRVLLADGAVELQVLESDGTAVKCKVVSGGEISDSKGINLPGVQVSTPSLTKKDIADLRFALEQGIDMVALSFVRKRDDVLRLRVHLEEHEARIPVIAKIEKPEAWANLDSILEEADGVMIARGDLGVEMALEKVPSIQKAVARRARKAGKFVITATQMLDSMANVPYPTRAEVSDVANAIYDGTDAVMLSGETASGRFPVEAAKMMERIATEAECTALRFRELPPRDKPTAAEIVAEAAYRSTQAAAARAVVVFTMSGSTARLIARYRPPVPIYAFTSDPAVARQLQVVYGVTAVLAPAAVSTDEMMAQLDAMLVRNGSLAKGDTVIFVAGQPVGRAGTTNLMKLHRVGELLT